MHSQPSENSVLFAITVDIVQENLDNLPQFIAD